MGLFFDRRCPYCNVRISDSASKCPHCGEWLISEKEKKQLDKSIQEAKKLEEQVKGFIFLCLIIVFIVLAIFVAVDGIKDTFFNRSETDSVQENVIEQKGDIIDTAEDDYNNFENKNQQQKQINNPVQPKPQRIAQPIKQQQTTTQSDVAVPQTKQNNQEIDDFMN